MTASKDRPSRTRRVRRMNGDDREREILASFEELLAERSLHEFSIDDIARGAGISRPTFYFYFPSKDAVLLSLLDRMVQEARAGRDAALADAARDPVRAWRGGIEAFYKIFRAHKAVSLAAADARTTNAEVRALWSQVMTALADETAEAIEGERARGAAPAGAPARYCRCAELDERAGAARGVRRARADDRRGAGGRCAARDLAGGDLWRSAAAGRVSGGRSPRISSQPRAAS